MTIKRCKPTTKRHDTLIPKHTNEQKVKQTNKEKNRPTWKAKRIQINESYCVSFSLVSCYMGGALPHNMSVAVGYLECELAAIYFTLEYLNVFAIQLSPPIQECRYEAVIVVSDMSFPAPGQARGFYAYTNMPCAHIGDFTVLHPSAHRAWQEPTASDPATPTMTRVEDGRKEKSLP